MGEWPHKRIKDVALRIGMDPFGSSIKVETFVPQGVPIILGSHLHATRLVEKSFKYVTEEHAERLQNSNVYRGDVVFTHRGTIGQCSYIPENSKYPRYIVSQSQFYMRCDTTQVLPEYVAYYFGSHAGQYQLLANSAQIGVPSIARPSTYLRDLLIPIPPIAEQRKITEHLGALDDKIELNRRMNTTLEAMARALFQSWFVDFDPVRAKAEGRQPIGMDAGTAALFPDSFEDSALGPIPKGWEVTNLGAVLNELETGRRPKGGVASYSSGVPSVGAESINGVGVFDYSKTKYVPKDFYDRNPSGRVKDWDVLLYKDGGKPGEFRPRVGMYALGFPFEIFSINEHVFRMRADRIGQPFLYFTVSSQRALEDFANKGGKAAIPGINQPDVKSTLVVLPVAKVLLQFNQIAQQLAEMIIRNAARSKTYSELRGTLLPRLISGELRVGEVAA